MDVARHLCEEGDEPIPDALADCEVPCPLDCEVSEWEDWEECSSVCGYGKALTEPFFSRKIENLIKHRPIVIVTLNSKLLLDIQVYQ